MVPIDVEVACVRRAGAILKNVCPPWVVETGCHVIGHNIKKKAHTTFPKIVCQGIELLISPKFGVQLGGVRHIIAMETTAPCLQNRGSVEIRNTQIVQVRHQCPSVFEAESPIQLQPIRSNGHSWPGHLIPRALTVDLPETGTGQPTSPLPHRPCWLFAESPGSSPTTSHKTGSAPSKGLPDEA